MSLEEKKIENLKKQKEVLKDKISRINLQLQQLKIEKEGQKLKHLKSKKTFSIQQN
jgi:hypothetical protein